MLSRIVLVNLVGVRCTTSTEELASTVSTGVGEVGAVVLFGMDDDIRADAPAAAAAAAAANVEDTNNGALNCFVVNIPIIITHNHKSNVFVLGIVLVLKSGSLAVVLFLFLFFFFIIWIIFILVVTMMLNVEYNIVR